MKLVALQNLTVPEGSFSAGQAFSTSDDIAARVIGKGHARPEGDTVVSREPEIESRDPAPAKARRKK